MLWICGVESVVDAVFKALSTCTLQLLDRYCLFLCEFSPWIEIHIESAAQAVIKSAYNTSRFCCGTATIFHHMWFSAYVAVMSQLIVVIFINLAEPLPCALRMIV